MKNILKNIIILLVLIALPPAWSLFAAESNITLLLTTNLNGRFSISAKSKSKEDPMLLIAQDIQMERQNNTADLILDLGNAFYPGLLSRFSFGSIMMDYLDDFGFDGTLVSSQDLNIGVSNLEFLDHRKRTRLLSANVEKSGKNVFAPYFIAQIQGKKLAFVGITSGKGLLDVAEKKLFGASIKNVDSVLPEIISALKEEHVDYIVALSGLSYADNLGLMERYQDVSLCISGGDSLGNLYGTKASRVDMESGRSILTLTRSNGYYLLTLGASDKLAVHNLTFNAPVAVHTDSDNYTAFVKRLKLWKYRFAARSEETVAKNIRKDMPVNGEKVAQLLRDKYQAEVAMIEDNAIIPGTFSGEVTYSDIITMVNNEFPIFTYKLSGDELKRAVREQKGLVIAGTDGDQVQGYPIEDRRNYQICSTQSVYDRLIKQFDKDIPYFNTWKTLSDEIRTDLTEDQIIARDDFEYLDQRFRLLVDFYLSNFFEQGAVSRNNTDDIPLGNPAETYTKWGLENKVDLTFYNKNHNVVLTPYINYIRQDNLYLYNLLRGTLFYTYNLAPHLKPYHKSQVDTVVQKVDDLRPVLVRETVGFFFQSGLFSGKAGLGFEKQTQDPSQEIIAGLEAIVDAKVDIYPNVAYTFTLDSFYGLKKAELNRQQIRAEVANALSIRLNSHLSVSARHRLFFFDAPEYQKRYIISQTLLSLDLRTDFKFF